MKNWASTIAKYAVGLGSMGVILPALSQRIASIGKEVAVEAHLRDGQEYELSIPQLVRFGEGLFAAKWTIQEGAGRPDVKGTGSGPRLSDPSQALRFPRNFNRSRARTQTLVKAVTMTPW
jgi:hypothetical protein